MVQQCVREGKYVVSVHAQTKHTTVERFTVAQGISALLNGEVIEFYPDRDRALICGKSEGIQYHEEYIGNYIHVTVRVELRRNAQVVVISMYRPSVNEWSDYHTRKRLM